MFRKQVTCLVILNHHGPLCASVSLCAKTNQGRPSLARARSREERAHTEARRHREGDLCSGSRSDLRGRSESPFGFLCASVSLCAKTNQGRPPLARARSRGERAHTEARRHRARLRPPRKNLTLRAQRARRVLKAGDRPDGLPPPKAHGKETPASSLPSARVRKVFSL